MPAPAHQTDQQKAFAEVWELLCDLGKQNGVTPLNKLPEPWHRIAGKWEFWLNAKGEDWPLPSGGKIPPFTVYVEFNGWPAGFLDPHGGSIAAGGLANIFTFRDALKAEIKHD